MYFYIFFNFLNRILKGNKNLRLFFEKNEYLGQEGMFFYIRSRFKITWSKLHILNK
jgi:hypothetical protein